MNEEPLEVLIFLQVHRSYKPATDAVIDRFATTAERHRYFDLLEISSLLQIY